MSCSYCKNPQKKHITPSQATENDKCISFIIEDSLIAQTFKDGKIIMETNIDINNCPFCGELLKHK